MRGSGVRAGLLLLAGVAAGFAVVALLFVGGVLAGAWGARGAWRRLRASWGRSEGEGGDGDLAIVRRLG